MKKIILLMVSVLVALIIGEGLALFCGWSKTYSSYPWQRNQGAITDYTPVRNSDGYRDYEFDNTIYTIACIGDSVTEGYRVKAESTYPKLIEKMTGYGVMNLGISGNSMDGNLKSFEFALKFNPQIIIYQFGLNDVTGFEHREIKSPVKEPLTIKSLLRRSVLYLALAERYNYIKLKRGKRTWIFDEWNITDEIWRGEFRKLKEAFGDREVLVIYIPYDYQVFSPREEVMIPAQKLEKFCRKNGYGFIDFTEVFKNSPNIWDIYLDDCHLTEYGHKIVAKTLYEYKHP